MEKHLIRKKLSAAAAAKWMLCLFLFAMCLFAHPGRAEADLATEQKVFRYLVEKLDLNPAAACGIMGNIEAESKFNVGITGLGGAFGLCQWAGVRLSRLSSFCPSRGLSTYSVEGQLAFAKYELQTYFPRVYAYLRSVSNTASGAYQAAYYWCMHFEAPANAGYASAYRGSIAQNVMWPRHGAGALYLTAESVKDGIELTWSGSSSYGFELQRAESEKGEYETIATLKKSKRSYVDLEVMKRKKYYYRVCPLKKDGKTGTASNRVEISAFRLLEDSACTVKLKEKTYTYTGKAIVPAVRIYYDGKKLKEGRDYSLSCRNNVSAGKAVVTITGKGGYRGSVKKKYTIEKQKVTVKVKDTEKKFTPGRIFTPKVKIKGLSRAAYTLRSSDRSVAAVRPNGHDLQIRGMGVCEVRVEIRNTGSYKVTGNTFTVTIRPAKPKLRSVKISGTDIRVKWKADPDVSGYEVQVSADSAFEVDGESFTVKGGKNSSVELEGLTGTEACYIRLRSYKLSADKERIYSKWTEAEPAKEALM